MRALPASVCRTAFRLESRRAEYTPAQGRTRPGRTWGNCRFRPAARFSRAALSRCRHRGIDSDLDTRRPKKRVVNQAALDGPQNTVPMTIVEARHRNVNLKRVQPCRLRRLFGDHSHVEPFTREPARLQVLSRIVARAGRQ